MVSLAGLRRAATNPAGAFANLANRSLGRYPRSAKALFHASRVFERNPTERILRLADVALVDGDIKGALGFLKMAIATQPTVAMVYETGMRLALAGFDDMALADALSATLDDEVLKAMFRWLLQSPKPYHPSKFWRYFMVYNAFQLDTFGIANFKRTANNNYFTWTGDGHVDEQTKALESLYAPTKSVIEGDRPPEFNPEKWARYTRFLTALHDYAKSKDALGILDRLEEPLAGNPISLVINGRRVSQDLCHTTIELNAIVQGAGLGPNDAFTVYELGAGHGRIGLALLSLFPRSRYVVVDIPPALHISQWYLSQHFQDDRIFRCRDFARYEEVAGEFDASRLAFLLPHQAALLPDKQADVFVNICSIQEMTRAHVDLWFAQIDRLCRRWFYTKQYIHHYNGADRCAIGRGDYPVRSGWSAAFDRQCEAFPSLFEALYRIG